MTRVRVERFTISLDGCGIDVMRQVLRRRLIDEMHVAIAPVLPGSGERLFVSETDDPLAARARA
jgi:dihydrofolate reductase